MEYQYYIDIGMLIALIALFYLVIYLLIYFSARTTGKFASLSIANAVYKELKDFPFLIWVSATGLTVLNLPEIFSNSPIAKDLIVVGFSVVLILSIVQLFNSIIDRYFTIRTRKAKGLSNAHYFKYFALITKTFLWVCAIVLLLTTVGVDINSFFAFLGFTSLGLSIAFRNTIKDALNSFIIVFQKPFEVGDYIKSGELYGQVREINLKSTILRSIDEKRIIIPNSILMDKAVTNFQNRNQIKVTYDIVVETPKLGRYERKMQMIEKKLYSGCKNIEKDSIEMISTSLTPQKHSYTVTCVIDLEDRTQLDNINRDLIHLIFNTFKDQGMEISEVSLDRKIDPFSR